MKRNYKRKKSPIQIGDLDLGKDKIETNKQTKQVGENDQAP